jgi:Holliday junction DNA helicase RuvA
MYSYIIGKITSLNKRSVTVESNYFGYHIFVPKTEVFEVGKVNKIYIVKNLSLNNNKNRITEEMYGFLKYEEKEFFLKLLNVTGIGYKTAINICFNDIAQVKNLISAKSQDALGALPGITPKIAKNLIDEIFFSEGDNLGNNPQSEIIISQLIRALSSLGYEKKEINFALQNISYKENAELSDLISEAIKHIAKQEEGNANQFASI